MSAEPFISSDPNAFLQPYWAELHRQSSFFTNLAPELQAKALADAIAQDHPVKAVEIREWNPITRRAMIAVLDQALKERHTARTTELWRMRKGEREVSCVAVYTSAGVDLRLLEGTEMLRTELCREAPLLRARAEQWRKNLKSTGASDGCASQRSGIHAGVASSHWLPVRSPYERDRTALLVTYVGSQPALGKCEASCSRIAGVGAALARYSCSVPARLCRTRWR